MFSFAEIEIADPIPLKNSCLFVLVLYYANHFNCYSSRLAKERRRKKKDEEEAEEKHVLAGCCFPTLVLLVGKFGFKVLQNA